MMMYIRIYEVYIRTYAIEGETKKEYYIEKLAEAEKIYQKKESFC